MHRGSSPSEKEMTTFDEAWKLFRELSPEEQGRFFDTAKQMVRFAAENLVSGAKVQFQHSKTGAVITGEFIRMKTKNAEVRTTQDRFGRDTGLPLFWNVPPEMLRVVAP